MGAEFVTRHYPQMTPNALLKAFEAWQDDARREEPDIAGSSYSGTIVEAHGLEFPLVAPFERAEEADDYLVETCDKWGPARAVQFKQAGTTAWQIGAWCAS